MMMRLRVTFFACALIAGTTLLAAMSLAQAPALRNTGGTIVVVVEGLTSSAGRVGCSLFATSDGWPNERSKALQGEWAPITDNAARCAFSNVPRGTYAVGMFHDANNNSLLDTSIVGRPREDWGVSNNTPGRTFGPPNFADCTFPFDGITTTLHLRVHD
jgi:uncharacterized protein (DUF2141 family)